MPDKKNDPRERLIVALDASSMDDALRAVDMLGESARWFKVGCQLFTSCGSEVVGRIKRAGFKVFLDLKFHDIPATVSLTGRCAADMDVDIFNVHALGGWKMMKTTVEDLCVHCAKAGKPRPSVIAVTVLTSMTAVDLNEIGVPDSPAEEVLRLARLAKASGLDGVVASPLETRLIRERVGDDFLIITPGVRPSWAGKDDQIRIKTPAEAIKDGADHIVVGRPILKAANPADAAKRVLDEIASAMR
jgi:orotidine-5'-phosphate decarboxylase